MVVKLDDQLQIITLPQLACVPFSRTQRQGFDARAEDEEQVRTRELLLFRHCQTVPSQSSLEPARLGSALRDSTYEYR